MEEIKGYGGTFIGEQIDEAIQKSIDDIPTKYLTQAEYEALSGEEKAKDILYITPGEGAESPPAENVYSMEETRIGTWMDGKPLYRKVLELTTPNTLNTDEIIYTFNGIDIKQMHGYIWYLGADKVTPGYSNLPFSDVPGNSAIWIYNNALFWKTSMTLHQNATITLIIEYTKATD